MKNIPKIIIPGGTFIISTILGLLFWYLKPNEKIEVTTFQIVVFGCVLIFFVLNTLYGFIKIITIQHKEQKIPSKKALENFYNYVNSKDYKKAWDLLDEKQYLKVKYVYEDFVEGYKQSKGIHNIQINVISCTDPLRHIYYVSYIDEFDLPIIDNFRIIEVRLADLYHELEKISNTDFFKIISDIPLRYFFLLNRDEFLTFSYPKLRKYITSYRTKSLLRGYEATLVRKNKKTKTWKILKLHEISPLANY
jgi:hypothetical protein